MKRGSIVLLFLLLASTSFSQEDTIVRFNGKKYYGEYIHETPHSVLLQDKQHDTVEIGKHLIGYIRLRNNQLEKFRYNKWKVFNNKNPFLDKGFYFNMFGGSCLYEQSSWEIDDQSGEPIFSKSREVIPRVGLGIGNRWLIVKTRQYGLLLGAQWLRISLTPGKYELLETSIYEDWKVLGALANPELTNVLLINKKVALQHSISSGLVGHPAQGDGGYTIENSLQLRVSKIGLGFNYIYNNTKDAIYGKPITYNNINFIFSVKL